MLRLVRETGVTILVVTHDLGLAWNIADRIAVMYLGRIVEQGTTEELLGDPRHPYTRALLSVVPETAHMEPQILAGEAPDPTRIPARLPLPSPLPARRLGRGRAAGDRGALPRRGPGLEPVAGAAPGSAHRAACHAVPTAAAAPRARSVRVTTRLTYTSGAAARPRPTPRSRPRSRRPARAGGPAPPRRRRRTPRSTAPAFERRDPSRTGRGREPRARGAGRRSSPRRSSARGPRSPAWRRSRVAERCAALRRAGAAISERHMELAAAVTLETGKSRTESIAEVQEAVDLIEAYCEQIERHGGYEVALGRLSAEETNAACCGRSACSA